jgi:membrane protein YqaA with SNARE-associated domain
LSPLTAGEAFQATITRQKKLEAAGYKVCFVMLYWMLVVPSIICLKMGVMKVLFEKILYILGALHLGV